MGSSGHNNHPVEIDPITLQESTRLWNGFLTGGKVVTAFVVVVLLLMGFFLV